MQVTKERFEDAGEPDADGGYDYYYSGFIYRFVFPGRELIARRSYDTMGQVSFLRFQRPNGEGQRSFSGIPYEDLEFREAVDFLRGSEGIEAIDVLIPESCGYVRVDLDKLAG